MDSRRIAEIANPNWKQARRERYGQFKMPTRAEALPIMEQGRQELKTKLHQFNLSPHALEQVCGWRSFLLWFAWPKLNEACLKSSKVAANYLFSNILNNVGASPYMDHVGENGNTYIYNATTEEVATLIVSISRMTEGHFDFDQYLTIIKL